jgi:hypothetical protein
MQHKETIMRTAKYSAVMASATLALAGLGLAVLAPAAFASDDQACTTEPKVKWQTIEQLSSKLVEQGYKIMEIEFDDGCLEAEGVDKDGKKVELKLDPVTAAIVKSEVK